MKCSNCGNEVIAGAMCCSKCGAKIIDATYKNFCERCGTKNFANQKFCMKCGSSMLKAKFAVKADDAVKTSERLELKSDTIKKKKKKKKIVVRPVEDKKNQVLVIIVIMLVILICGAITGMFVYFTLGEGENESTNKIKASPESVYNFQEEADVNI